MTRTEMLDPRWSRSKWIINFSTGEDTGQRLRNSEAECYTTLNFFYKKLFYKKVSLNIGKNLRKSEENSEAQNTVLTRNLRNYQAEIRQITQLDTDFIDI